MTISLKEKAIVFFTALEADQQSRFADDAILFYRHALGQTDAFIKDGTNPRDEAHIFYGCMLKSLIMDSFIADSTIRGKKPPLNVAYLKRCLTEAPMESDYPIDANGMEIVLAQHLQKKYKSETALLMNGLSQFVETSINTNFLIEEMARWQCNPFPIFPSCLLAAVIKLLAKILPRFADFLKLFTI